MKPRDKSVYLGHSRKARRVDGAFGDDLLAVHYEPHQKVGGTDDEAVASVQPSIPPVSL